MNVQARTNLDEEFKRGREPTILIQVRAVPQQVIIAEPEGPGKLNSGRRDLKGVLEVLRIVSRFDQGSTVYVSVRTLGSGWWFSNVASIA